MNLGVLTYLRDYDEKSVSRLSKSASVVPRIVEPAFEEFHSLRANIVTFIRRTSRVFDVSRNIEEHRGASRSTEEHRETSRNMERNIEGPVD